jgi:tetratricopeptide (TPR) repeat protein
VKNILFHLLFGFSITNTYACLNGERITLPTGTPLYFDYSGSVPRGHLFISRKQLLPELKALDNLYKKTRNLDYLSDKGLVLIVLGRYSDAIKLYEQIEKVEPGRYSTASNIGTTYELIGENELALKWIQKALIINPESHNGSEWIHVNILKNKISKDTLISSQALIGMDFGTDHRPKSSLSKKSLSNLADALFYQLNERISFIKPEDAIIAQLLFDYANINILINDNSTALGCYEDAKEYGFYGKLIDIRYQMTIQRIKELDSIIIHNEMEKLGYVNNTAVIDEKLGWFNWVWGGIALLTVFSTRFILYKRKIKKASRK